MFCRKIGSSLLKLSFSNIECQYAQAYTMMQDVFSQHGFRLRIDWGRDGARRAAQRGDVIVIVDVLSFSSAVATAVYHGGIVVPCAKDDDADAIARQVGGVVAVSRRAVHAAGCYSLSPLTYVEMAPETTVVLPSPNGATCSRYAAQVPYLFVGALLNANAVATAVGDILRSTDLDCTVIACGERWQIESTEGEELRFAIEDYLGAGAILSGLHYSKSPEALLCETAFKGTQNNLAETLLICGSGRELIERGFQNDVLHAALLDKYDVAAVMRDGQMTRFG
jgi:2-phosphosulfolactate phosphatase